MRTFRLEVQGMCCGGSVKSVTAALSSLPCVSNVEVDLPAGHVTVNGDLPWGGDSFVLALTAAGYPAKLTSAIAVSPSVKKSGGCCG